VWASGTNEDDTPTTIDGKTLEPGDIYLGDDSALLLNKELTDDPDVKPTDLEKLKMTSWLR